MFARYLRGGVFGIIGLIGLGVASVAYAECKNDISTLGIDKTPDKYHMGQVTVCQFSLENSRLKPADSWIFNVTSILPSGDPIQKLDPGKPQASTIPVTNNLCRVTFPASSAAGEKTVRAYSNSATICATVAQLYFQQKAQPDNPIKATFQILFPVLPVTAEPVSMVEGSLEYVSLK